MRHEMLRVVHSSRARNSMPSAEFQVMPQKGPHSPTDPTPTMVGSRVDLRSTAPLARLLFARRDPQSASLHGNDRVGQIEKQSAAQKDQ
jgi:hypothetical protein